jgi:hypothetical protein
MLTGLISGIDRRGENGVTYSGCSTWFETTWPDTPPTPTGAAAVADAANDGLKGSWPTGRTKLCRLGRRLESGARKLLKTWTKKEVL